MIRSIRLIRFKQFEDTTVQLRPFSILMGENNSGKTTTLQAIWLALSSLHQGKLIECDDRRGITKVSKSGYYMSKIPFTAEGDYHSLFYNRVSRRGQAYDETSGALIEITDNKSNSIRIHLREIFNNMNFKVLTPSNELASPELQNYEPLYISGFLGLQSQEERMFPATLDERSSSGRVSSIVRNIILDLKLHDEEKYRLLECVSKCISTRIMQAGYGYRRNGRKQGSGKRAYHSEWRLCGTP